MINGLLLLHVLSFASAAAADRCIELDGIYHNDNDQLLIISNAMTRFIPERPRVFAVMKDKDTIYSIPDYSKAYADPKAFGEGVIGFGANSDKKALLIDGQTWTPGLNYESVSYARYMLTEVIAFWMKSYRSGGPEDEDGDGISDYPDSFEKALAQGARIGGKDKIEALLRPGVQAGWTFSVISPVTKPRNHYYIRADKKADGKVVKSVIVNEYAVVLVTDSIPAGTGFDQLDRYYTMRIP